MYYGKILDPIHGTIVTSEIEKWVINQSLFGRLRRIKQNTFLYLVFPSSNHTRFEHSLGVMHLAHQIYENTIRNFEAKKSKQEKNGGESVEYLNLYSPSIGINDVFQEKVVIQELRLAALLHDIGHGPMSHLFDTYTINGRKLIEIIDEDEDLKCYEANFIKLLEFHLNQNLDLKVPHEIISCVFIVKLLTKLKKIAKEGGNKFTHEVCEVIDSMDIKRVIIMVEPNFDITYKITFNNLDYTNFFHSIISGFPLDADRMDYLYRDSYFSGVKYGQYDLSRIMMSFIPVKQENEIYLAVKESGMDSVIRFIQSRLHLYSQVYFHKTNRAANLMLDLACKKGELGSKSIVNCNNYDELEKFYLVTSDEIFLNDSIRKNLNNDGQKVLDELLFRKLFKRIFENKYIFLVDCRTEKDKVKKLAIEAKERLKNDGLDIMIDFVSNIALKDSDSSKLRITKKTIDGKYELVDNWTSYNHELRALNYEIFTIRVYIRRDFNSSEDFELKKTNVLEKLQEFMSKCNEYWLKYKE